MRTITPHQNQLKQLQKLDKQAYAKACYLVEWGLLNHAKQVIVEAMKKALADMNKPPSLWELVERAIKAENIPTASKREVKLTKQVSLRYRNDGYICLYGFYIQSRPIVMWGRDSNAISGSYVGKWKFTFEAKRNFEIWQQETGLYCN